MKKFLINQYKKLLIYNVSLTLKYKRFLDNQLDKCYHST